MTIFIGDVHGKYGAYKRLMVQSRDTVQVGDMGLGFRKYPHGELQSGPPFDYMVKDNHRFIRGNHDNPAVCRNHAQFIVDGFCEELDGRETMFCGGATSIDRAMRIEGFSWWEDEQLSHDEMNKVVDRYLVVKPKVMVTHDCPQEVAEALFLGHYKDQLEPGGTRTRQAFQSMWSAHSPELWVFGHWHQSKDVVLRGTRFVCLAELEMKDL